MSKTEESALVGGATNEQIEGFKAKHGTNNVKVADLAANEEGTDRLEVIVKVPSRNELSEFEKWLDKNPGKSKDILINACVLTRLDQVKANDYLYSSAFDAVTKLIPIGKAVIKNL